jgi:beta-lactamase class A
MIDLNAGAHPQVPGSMPLAEDNSHRGRQVRWLLELISTARPFEVSAVNERFVPAFLLRHPGGLAPLIEAWRSRGPLRVRSYVPVAHKAWLEVREADGTESVLNFVFDSTGRIRVAALLPAVEIPTVDNWDEVDQALQVAGVESSLLAVRLTAQGPQVLHELAADRAMPSGSTFKYYVLHALFQAIQAGTVRWDQRLRITPYRRSLPSGDLQDLPDGTLITVADAAHKMMTVSDNTGSDLLIDLLGRPAVENCVVAMGHHDPALLRPFPMTREIFEIGWGAPRLRQEWVCGDEARRRELLAEIAARPITVAITDMQYPVHQDGLDWRMSCRDLATVMAAVWEDARQDQTGILRRALTANTGAPMPDAGFRMIGFKGGSNPGVLCFSWMAEDETGAVHLLVLMQRSPDPSVVRDNGRLRWTGQQVVTKLLAQPATSTVAR